MNKNKVKRLKWNLKFTLLLFFPYSNAQPPPQPNITNQTPTTTITKPITKNKNHKLQPNNHHQSETITLHVPKPILMNHDPMLATHRSISKPPLATNQSCRCHHTDKVVTNTKQIDQRAEREGRGWQHWERERERE